MSTGAELSIAAMCAELVQAYAWTLLRITYGELSLDDLRERAEVLEAQAKTFRVLTARLVDGSLPSGARPAGRGDTHDLFQKGDS